MTATIIPFPRKEALRMIKGTDRATGQPVTMLEHVSAEGRMIVAECQSATEFEEAIRAWLEDDVDLWPEGVA